MTLIRRLLEPNHARFDGIRPINIYGMRFVYILMATLLAIDVWGHILTRDQQWCDSIDFGLKETIKKYKNITQKKDD